MPSSRFQSVLSVAVAGALCFSSSAAVAATIPSARVQVVNPWATLSVLSSGAAATVLCGAAAAVAADGLAQGVPGGGCVLPVVDAAPAPVAAAEPPLPVPVPTMAAPAGGLGVSPLLLALGALGAGVLIYFLVRGKHHGNASSPA